MHEKIILNNKQRNLWRTCRIDAICVSNDYALHTPPPFFLLFHSFCFVPVLTLSLSFSFCCFLRLAYLILFNAFSIIHSLSIRWSNALSIRTLKCGQSNVMKYDCGCQFSVNKCVLQSIQ